MANVTLEKGWLSPAQAARILGLTPTRIRQLTTSGQLRHERTAIGRLIDPEAVEALRVERERKKVGTS